jgi:hypothetical protein
MRGRKVLDPGNLGKGPNKIPGTACLCLAQFPSHFYNALKAPGCPFISSSPSSHLIPVSPSTLIYTLLH